MLGNTPEIKGITCGLFAVVLWSLLPVLRQATALIPPMQLAVMSLGVAACMSTLSWLPKGVRPLGHIKLPAPAWLGSVGGLVGALFFYFLALVKAPAAEVALITYTWPLLFALSAEVVDREPLHAETLLGSGIAFAGASLLILGGSDMHIPFAHLPGYLSGMAAGASWVLYSLTMRRYSEVSIPAFPWIFAAAALVGFFLHLLWEQTVVSVGAPVLVAALGIGCGPYGAAFMAWSFGVRLGPPGVIGSLSYVTPVLSTLILIVLGNAQVEWPLGVAALSIVLGAGISGTDKKTPKPGG
ncbi:MAG: DMT family transporter [Desulfonatronovibrionaceae bacterium]